MTKSSILSLGLIFLLLTQRPLEAQETEIESDQSQDQSVTPDSKTSHTFDPYQNIPPNHDDPVIENTDHSDDPILNLQSQVKDLRGQLEVLQYELKQSRLEHTDLIHKIEKMHRSASSKQYAGVDPSDALSSDLDDDLKEKKSTSSTAASKSRPAIDQYERAQTLLAEENFEEAERVLKDLIRHHKTDPLVINAKYWLGESHLIQKHYKKAATSFAEAYKAYTKLDKVSLKENEDTKFASSKAQDALLKLAVCFKYMKDEDQACGTLEQLRSEFSPLHPHIQKGEERLSLEMKCKA